MRIFYIGILVAVLGFGGVSIKTVSDIITSFELPGSQYGLVSAPFTEGTLLFGGDIMLARDVEQTMLRDGIDAPFVYIREFVSSHDLAVANFEASVPLKHVPTPMKTMRFSVPESSLPALTNAGFDILSLANNHALDYGESGYNDTKVACARHALVCVGHPTRADSESVSVRTIGDTKVGVLMLHTLFTKISTSSIETIMQNLVKETDIQFAFIHWGDEYERTHNASQESLAHMLIENGVDAVIGHHPHVMQDIGSYKGKPIFYSLGNLVFDQYFDDEVERGYFVSIAFSEDTTEYRVVPYDMLRERSQPQIIDETAYRPIMEELFDPEYFSPAEITEGRFSRNR